MTAYICQWNCSINIFFKTVHYITSQLPVPVLGISSILFFSIKRYITMLALQNKLQLPLHVRRNFVYVDDYCHSTLSFFKSLFQLPLPLKVFLLSNCLLNNCVLIFTQITYGKATLFKEGMQTLYCLMINNFKPFLCFSFEILRRMGIDREQIKKKSIMKT